MKIKKESSNQSAKSIAIFIVSLAVIGWIIWLFTSDSASSPAAKEQILSRNGLHWHSELIINIKGQEQKIPRDIGIGATHQPIHTHESDNLIHLEIEGLVNESDTLLGKFFEIWDKKFNSQCIFDYCNSPEGKLKMFVNGKENNEFEKYPMKDKDKIEIKYE